MRKLYSSPGITFVPLASTSTGGCDSKATFATGACPVEIEGWGGETVFSDLTICDWGPEDGNACYHVPEPGWNVFES